MVAAVIERAGRKGVFFDQIFTYLECIFYCCTYKKINNIVISEKKCYFDDLTVV